MDTYCILPSEVVVLNSGRLRLGLGENSPKNSTSMDTSQIDQFRPTTNAHVLLHLTSITVAEIG
jgi:hypothetical protein